MAKIISAYVSEALAARVQEIVDEEHRKPSQVAANALDFYVILNPEVRRALLSLRDHGDPEDLRLFVTEVGRAAARAQLRVAQRAFQHMTAPDTETGTDREDDIDAFLLERRSQARQNTEKLEPAL